MEKKDNFFEQVFAHLPEAACIFEKNARTILAVNQAFERLTGYEAVELTTGQFVLENIVYKRDFKTIYRRLSGMPEGICLRDEVRLLNKDNGLREVEVAISKLSASRKAWFLCVLNDIGVRKDKERDLQDKISQERQKVGDAAKNILRTQNLLEKLHTLPVFWRELWKSQQVAELLEKAVHLLCHRSGLNYFEVAIFLKKGDYLELGYANRECVLRRFHLNKQHKFAQVARNEKKVAWDDTGEFILPMCSPQGIEGILQATLEETERVLVMENDALKQAHGDLLETICEFLGLMLSNFRCLQERELHQEQDPVSGFYQRRYFLQKLQEQLDAKNSFALALLEIDNIELMPFEQESIKIKHLSAVIKERTSANAIIGRIAHNQFVALIPRFSLAEVTNWVEQISHYGIDLSNFHGTSLAAGMLVHAGEPCELSTLWSHILACVQQGAKQESDKVCYWNNGVHNIAKHISTKLR